MSAQPRRLLACLFGALLGAVAVPAAAGDESLILSSAFPTTAAERDGLAVTSDCGIHRREFHGGTAAGQREAMTRELLAYQSLAEETLTMRAQAIRLLQELKEKDRQGKPLSGRDLQRLNQGAADMLEKRAALFRVSLAHECWLDDPVPTDPQAAALQATGIAMSLSAALILYDNYLSAISLYRSDHGLRQHFNKSDKGYGLPGGELNRIATSFASPENRARVRRGLVWFEKHGRAGAANGLADDQGYRYLAQLVEQSPSRQMVRLARPTEFIGNMLGFFSTLTVDSFVGMKNEGTHVSSLLFGNAVGLVESRRGKLDGVPHVLEKVSTTLRAGDILLEKTPFRLTDAFIPGHWGHAAVWVGSEAELRALGIWNHPVVRPHQQAIGSGRGVVEALRSGVVMNNLQHFLNIDDLAVLRQKELPPTQRAEVILQALRQVGKSYDFNFDVQSTDRIVCSELIYHTYIHLDWPTERHLGRVTISPDNVAVRATRVGPLDVALLYHDGKEVPASRDAMERFVMAEVVKLARR